MIDSIWKDELYKYITGIIQTQKHKLLIITGVADHVHVLHHKKITFMDEYKSFLKAYDVAFDEPPLDKFNKALISVSNKLSNRGERYILREPE